MNRKASVESAFSEVLTVFLDFELDGLVVIDRAITNCPFRSHRLWLHLHLMLLFPQG